MKNCLRTLGFLIVASIPLVAFANMPMVLMYGIGRFTFIPLVLIVEWLVLKYFFEFSWGKAAKASVVVNLVTYVIGIFAFPAMGMFFYGTPLIDLVGKYIVQGSLGEYLLIMLVAAIFDAAIELAVLKFGFRRILDAKRIFIWFLANLATALMVLLGVGFELSTDILSGKQLDSEEVACLKREHGAEMEFMRQIGREAEDNYNKEYEYGFDRDWSDEWERELNSFGNFKSFSLSSGGRNLNLGMFTVDWDTESDDLGSHAEPGLEIFKMESVQNGEPITTYSLRLTPESGTDYRIAAIIESDPDCIADRQ